MVALPGVKAEAVVDDFGAKSLALACSSDDCPLGLMVAAAAAAAAVLGWVPLTLALRCPAPAGALVP